MKSSQNRYKKIVYNYDLISGKVSQVAYQPGQADAFYHRYTYDAENRLTDVETSRDKLIWEKDARYYYYKHGPLARTILGQQQVQGIDYAYTLQGWLKAVNNLAPLPNAGTCPAGTALDELVINDRNENDAPAVYKAKTSIDFEEGFESNINDDFETIIDPNAAACSLTQPASDPTDMGDDGPVVAKDAYGFALHYFDEGSNHDYAAIGSTQPFANTMPSEFTSLYNGNIGAININVPKIGQPVLHSYKYDQLNRIKEVNNFNNYDATNNTWQPTQQHKEALTFDANGNVQTALLNGNNAQLAYENFNYNYDPVKKNRLLSITNSVSNTTSNYEYDESGNVTKDELEGNTQMDWNVYGKLSRVVKDDGTQIFFKYDASGNRIGKIVGAKEEWSVRDASGNIMATYLKDPTINNGKLSTESLYMYGSGMLGTWDHVIDVESNNPPPLIKTFTRNEKKFYLGNQVGNNLVVLSDGKTGFDDNGDGIIDRYEANVLSAADYSAYGDNLKGREFNSSGIQFGFNNKWNDFETGYQDYGMRMYSKKRRGFVSVDPITFKYPMLTPYQFASNRPIDGIDLDGLEYTPKGRYGPNQIAVDGTSVQLYSANPALIQQTSARIQFERSQQHFSTANNTYVSPERQQINNARTNDAGYDLDGSKKDWLKLAENKTFNKLADNIVLPIVTAAGVTDGVGSAYQMGKEFLLSLRFSSGATKLVSSEMLEAYGSSSTFGNPANTFVSPTSEINELLNKGYSRQKIAETLGITDKRFLKGDLLRIDVTPEALKSLNLRSTIGNEVGANEAYIKGNKTIGGVTEGIVNGIPKNGEGVSKTIIEIK